ncbi:hypothetical protein ABW19_dt0200017 [Dactylella cylindrospora]|nr:hypothetical protein ABW19_dt0200017 [Dactylella cylindrospora]
MSESSAVKRGREDQGSDNSTDRSHPDPTGTGILSFAGDPFANHHHHHHHHYPGTTTPNGTTTSINTGTNHGTNPFQLIVAMARRESLRHENFDPSDPFAKRYRTEIAALTSSVFSTLSSCPFEFTKLSSQIEFLLKQSKIQGKDKQDFGKVYSKLKGAGTFESAKRIVETRGFRGLYSGFHLHLTRDVLGTGIYFMMYETFKRSFSSAEGTSHVAIAVSGGLCGLISWAMIYPIDSSKSIYQRKILSTPPGEPLTSLKYPLFHRRMYRGLGVSMARSCLLNAIFFSSYERIVYMIDNDVD